MLPSHFRFGRSFVFRTLIISALIGSLFAAGCTTNSAPPNPAPMFTSAGASGFAFIVGTAGTFAVTATGTPAPTLSESGALPNGLTFTASTGILSGTPAAGTSGSYTITFTAHNGAGPDAVQTFTLTVNLPAAITTANNTTFTVGTAGTFTVTATGFPAPTFSETGALPSGVTLASATGLLSGTPAAGAGGTYLLTITAHNGAGMDSTQSFTLTVDQASAITSANTAAFTVGSPGTFTVTATAFPAPTLSETGALPSGVTFTPATGKLAGTPGAGTAGSYPITFTAHNGVGADALQSFTLTVGQAPAITTTNSATFTVGTAGTFTVTATGFPAPSFSEAGLLPTGVTFNTTTGVLSGTPGAGTGGSYPIIFTALNGVGTNATQNFTLAVNQAPVINSPSSITFVVGTAGAFVVTASAFPNSTFSETGALPGGVTLTNNGNGTASLAGTPAPGSAGTYPLTFTAHNGIGTDAMQSFTLTVDQAPAITSANNTTFTVGTAGTFTVMATGLPAPSFSEAGSLPAGVTFNTTTGVLSGTPGAGTGGTYPVVFTALNGVGTNSTQNFTLTVNQAPLITSAINATFTVGALGTFTVTATGPPAPTLIETGALPTGVTFTDNGNGNGTLSGTPGTQGTFPITFTAHNGIGTDAMQNFTLTVNQAPVFTSVNNTTFTVGTAGTFTVMAGGVPAPTFSETGTLPSGVTFTAATGVLGGTPGASTGGTYPITFTAHNGSGADAMQSFTLTVDQAPFITSVNNATFTAGAAGTFTVTATGFPAPTFSETGALPGGVTLNSSTGVLSGTPAAGSAGSYPLMLTAHNGIGTDAVQTFTLTVTTAPAITSINNTTFTAGTAGTFTVTATGTPVPSVTESGAPLPTGVTFNTTTGVLSGTPGVGTGGLYFVTFTAHSGVGADAVQNFTLTVNEAPAITSPNSFTMVVGQQAGIVVTALGWPNPTLTESGTLPGGVTFGDAGHGTGGLSGTPAVGSAATYHIMLTAHNGVGADFIQNFTLTVTTTPAIVGTSVPFPIFAGDPATTIAITVTSDSAGDVLTPTLTVDSNTGLACTVATCGTVGSITGTSGSGSYSLSYTPPPTAGFTTQTVPTIVVSSSLSGSFAATDFIEVDPAGVPLVLIGGGGINNIIQVGTAVKTVTVTVYNDPTGAGVTFTPLTASGYACGSTNTRIGTNLCGTLGTPSAPVLSGTTTTTTITYTPPPSLLPFSPYDRPRLPAVSNANHTQLASGAFVLSSNPPPVNTGLTIVRGLEFNSALAATGAVPLTVFATVGNDVGNSRTVTWTLTAGGANCSPTCGTLGSQVDTGNGATVSSQINYTPPSSVPTVAADLTPTITATSVDATSQTDSFTFTIVDGSCGTGNNAVLSGSYAFMVRGGGMNAGYAAIIGSFTANGGGGITSGLLDYNNGLGPVTGLTIGSAGSSYTVGTGNRVCLVLADSQGGVENFRAGVGTLVAGVATQGRIIRYDDNNGRRPRQSGVLMKQDTTSFANNQFSGNFAFGEEGVDGSGGRFAGAGVVTSNGAGSITDIIGDFDDAGTVTGAVTGGTGTYAIAANGRGTASTTLTVLGKPGTTNLVLYMVSSSEALIMSTDSLPAGKSIFSGELKKQTGPFSNTTFDNKDYVIYGEGLGSNGGNDTFLAQATFTTNGTATLTSDENNDGTEGTEKISTIALTIASNGRTTITGGGGGGSPPVLYLIDSSSAFLVDTSGSASFGYVEQQTGGPFSDASLSGQFFFGGDAPTTGSNYMSGTVTVDGAGGVTGNGDHSGPNGLGTDTISPSSGGTYSFSTSSVPQGKGIVGTTMLSYVISGSKLIFMQTSSNPEITIIQK